MKCIIEGCENVFWNDLDYNTHLLFYHGLSRSMCATNVEAKRLQIADLMRHDFDRVKNKPYMELDAYYIIYKQHELGIENIRNLWEFTGNTYVKHGKTIKEKVMIPYEKILKMLEGSYYMNSNRARYYDERYSLNNLPSSDKYD